MVNLKKNKSSNVLRLYSLIVLLIALYALIGNIIALLTINIPGNETPTFTELCCTFDLSVAEYIIIQICLIVDIFCFVLVIISAKNWFFFTLAHVLQGIVLTFDSSGATSEIIIGSLMIIMGYLVAFSNNFCKRKALLKTSIFLFLLIAPPLFNPFVEWRDKTATILLIIFVIWVFILCYFLFKDYLSELLPPIPKRLDSKNGKLDISEYNFDERELFCIRETLSGNPYKSMAIELHCSESVIKKIMVNVFQKFGVSTREQLIGLLMQYEIVYPKKKLNSKV